MRYYRNGRETDVIIGLKEQTGKDLEQTACQFPYDLPDTIFPTLDELIRELG